MRVLTALLWIGLIGCGDPPPPCNRGLSTGTDVIESSDNIVVVLIDDVGVERFTGWGADKHAAHTPVLDALEGEAVKFSRAYASPSCSPTRAALLTGRRARRTGIGTWIDPRVDSFDLADSEVTIPEMLRSSPRGPWSTAIVGKWHLSIFDDDAPEDPYTQGFDTFYGLLGNASMSWRKTPGERSYTYWEYFADRERSISEDYLTTVTTDDAIAQLDSLREPFFLYVAYSAAHSPFHIPPAELIEAFAATSGDVDQFDSMVESLDTELGRLFAAIDASDTTVIVVSDNGTPEEAAVGLLDQHHAKNSVHEGGTHVPMWVWGSAVTRPGTTSDVLVHVTDIFATVADLAGVELEALDVEIDGRSFASSLDWRDEKGRRCLVSERFPDNGRPQHKLERSIRDDDYLLVQHHGESDELYDLNTRRGDLGDDLLQSGTPSKEAEGAYRRLSRWLEQDLQAVR